MRAEQVVGFAREKSVGSVKKLWSVEFVSRKRLFGRKLYNTKNEYTQHAEFKVKLEKIYSDPFSKMTSIFLLALKIINIENSLKKR